LSARYLSQGILARPEVRRRLPLLAAGLGMALIALASAGPPQLLINHTPSEPLGPYWRIPGGPVVGALIAFPAPAAAFPYADRRLSYLRRELMLKAVGAGPGDRVCTVGTILTINDVVRATIADRDGQGALLPRWRACRRLQSGELFVFSNRVPNAFDSRYFGPISDRSVAGVYRRLGG